MSGRRRAADFVTGDDSHAAEERQAADVAQIASGNVTRDCVRGRSEVLCVVGANQIRHFERWMGRR